MKNIFMIILSLALSWPCLSFAQTERKPEIFLPREGLVRAFVIFAQIEGDNYGDEHYNSEIWPSGGLPVNPDSFIDTELKENSADYESLLSQTYNEISFGKLHIIGDYYPELVKIPSTNITLFTILDSIIRKATFKTAHGYTYPLDFDKWRMENNIVKQGGDGSADLKILIIRRTENSYNNGRCSAAYVDSTKMLKVEVEAMTLYGSETTLKHEVGHTYFPENRYHSGGHNAGARYFISELNGYDLMSGGDTFMKSYNAWNRNWIGWFPDNYAYEIQTMNQNGVLVNSDLDYMEHKGEVKEFIIRDTPSTGDAVRIKLPYVGNEHLVPNQYIWLENHQFLESTVNGRYWYNTNFTPKGLYINYQVGNDNYMAGADSVYALGISTLPSFGNYDYFSRDTVINGTVYKVQETSEEYNNPLSGQMMTEKLVVDDDNDRELTSKDLFNPFYTYFNGKLIPESDCVYMNYVYLGGKKQCFYEGDKAGIGYNPALTPKFTVEISHNRPVINKGDSTIFTLKSNKTSYLNGLSVEFVEQLADGSIKVRVRFDDYDVVNDVRWCGDIVLKEMVILKKGKTITFDRGFSPTREEKYEIFNGMKLFNDPTSFVAEKGSVFGMESDSKVIVRNGSTLTFKAGSAIALNDGARLVVESGSKLCIEKGAVINLSGDSQIVIEDGATFDFEYGAMLSLSDPESIIKIYENFINEGMDAQYIPFIGNGKIVMARTEYNIQNETIISEKEVYGKSVRAGSEVDPEKTNGNVTVKDNGKLIINYEKEVLLDNGFSTEDGAELIIRKDN